MPKTIDETIEWLQQFRYVPREQREINELTVGVNKMGLKPSKIEKKDIDDVMKKINQCSVSWKKKGIALPQEESEEEIQSDHSIHDTVEKKKVSDVPQEIIILHPEKKEVSKNPTTEDENTPKRSKRERDLEDGNPNHKLYVIRRLDRENYVKIGIYSNLLNSLITRYRTYLGKDFEVVFFYRHPYSAAIEEIIKEEWIDKRDDGGGRTGLSEWFHVSPREAVKKLLEIADEFDDE